MRINESIRYLGSTNHPPTDPGPAAYARFMSRAGIGVEAVRRYGFQSRCSSKNYEEVTKEQPR